MKITNLQWKKASPWLLISVLVIAIDQLSKYIIMKNLYVGEPLKLLPFFNFILSFNQGASFGFLNQAGGWQVLFLIAVTLIIFVILLIWLLRLDYPNSWLACALALILGGAIGNLIDRLRIRYVIDFLDFHLGDWHFATFNIADSAIVMGVTMIILQALYKKKLSSKM